MEKKILVSSEFKNYRRNERRKKINTKTHPILTEDLCYHQKRILTNFLSFVNSNIVYEMGIH